MSVSLTKSLMSATLLASIALPMGSALADSYTIDPAHSFIQFKTKHLGYSWLPGQFNKFDGKMTYSADKPASEQKIIINIDTSSIDTNWADRDKHLRSADFLNVEKFPTATFESTAFDGDAAGGTVTGNLTLHGVTREISFPVTLIAEGEDPWGGYRVGFEGSYTLARKDFNLDQTNLGPAAENIELSLLIEATKDQ